MNKTNGKSHTAILFLAAIAVDLAIAAPTSVIQKLNGTGVASGMLDLGSTRMLTIVGYAADLATMDPGTVNSVAIRHVEKGDVYSAPVLRRLASVDALLASMPGTAPASAGKLMNAGFLSVLDSYTLPPGTYEVIGVNFAPLGATTASTISPAVKAQFSIPAARIVSDVQIIGPDGSPVAVSIKPGTSTENKNIMFLAGYPALRSGNYTVKATARNKYGITSGNDSVSVRYTRPIVKADITVPMVEGFPGLPGTATLNSPLDNAPLTGAITGRMFLQNAVNGRVTVQGVEATTSEEKDIALAPKLAGRYQISGNATGGRGVARIWIDKPDAPDIEVSVGNWDPDTGIKVAKNREAYAPALDPVQILANAETGSNCSTIHGVGPGASISGEYSQPSCAIRYRTLPSGVTQETTMRANLKGYLASDGDQAVEFETGVLWTNPDTLETRFYRAKDRAVILPGIAPSEPDVTFAHVDKLAPLAKASPGRLVTYAGQSTAGRVTVSGKYHDMTVQIKVGSTNPKTLTTTGNSVRDFINTSVGNIWQSQDIVIESWYNKYPEKKFTKTLTFTAIPKEPVVVVKNTQAVSTDDVLIHGNLGLYQGASGGFKFDTSETGSWSVQLYDVDAKGERTAVGNPVNISDEGGAFEINLGKQPAGRRNFVAVGTLVDNPDGVSTQQITSTKSSLIIADGSPLAGTIEARQTSGPVPFTPSINIVLGNQNRVADIGSVEWYVSADGEAYTKVEGQSTALRPQIQVSGSVWYKAKLTNRFSNIANELAPLKVQAFSVPKVLVSGDTATFVGQPVVLSAASDGMDADYTWYISQSATDRNPQVVAGTDVVTITPTVPADMLIKVVGAERGAPADNPARNASTTTVLRAIRPGVQKPMVYGPSYVETGKSYEFKAVIPPLFAPGLRTSLSTKGRWVLPDGSTRDGETLQYTVQPADRALRYEAWVENVENTTAAVDFGLRTWTYAWPEWQVITRVVDNRVPATLRFQALLKNPRDAQKLGGEKPQYVWQFPPSFRVIEQTAESAVVEANEPGEFQAVATVSDSRGNSTQLRSDLIQIAPAPDLVPEVALQSGDRWNRAPNKLYARINLISMPKNDTFDSATFRLNGEEVASGRTVAAYIDVPTEGTHEVTAVVRSAGGKVGVASKTISLGVGDDPVCSIQQYGDGRTSLSLIARCLVQQGAVASYKWIVNGQAMPSSSYMLSFAKKDLDAGVSSVRVTATTDKGQTGTATWPQ